MAELALYDNELERHLLIVCDAAGTAVGCTGLLVSDTDAVCYLIGPLLHGAWRTVETAERTLELVLAQRVAPSALVGYIEDDNVVLAEALRRNGWRRGAAQLEMSCEIPATGTGCRTVAGQPPIRQLSSSGDPGFPAVAEMLGRHHHWSSDPRARLADYLDDGYQVAVLESAGHLAGCAVWIHVSGTDFGRLDYLSVSEEFRGRSYGTALTRHVLAEAAHTDAIERIYLSVDPGNEAARRVYRACGFEEGIISRQYSYSRW
ncbi:GNAT family N-acetyltransferase [Nocardia abscessus]|uniref:GNAT family N-acetyltransferase n=1 Tax=Nocardia abscessus TaxID=120957 RepID=UPI001893087F|nr:N-acetyltransferase [Nocardia abscessus]MBF6335099.1 GNAT family N-acetyltransferase [Nocardia abscessus]